MTPWLISFCAFGGLLSCMVLGCLNIPPIECFYVTMKTKKNSPETKFNRRQFLRSATVSAASFTILPASVLGLHGATSPNEKLNIAGIGIGGQGASDLSQMESENIVALCDVD